MENIDILKEQLPQLTISELANIVLRLYEGENINSVLDDYIVNIASEADDIQPVSEAFICEAYTLYGDIRCMTECDNCGRKN